LKTYLRILGYVKPYWAYLVLSITCTIIFALLNAASVYLTIPLLDTLFQEGGTAATQTAVSPNAVNAGKTILPQWVNNLQETASTAFKQYVFSGDKMDALLKICIIILVVFFVKNVAGYMQSFFLAFVEQGIVKDMRNDAYVHLHKLPMSFFKNERVGNLISRITNDVNILQLSISATFLNLVREPLTIIVLLGMVISISWRLTLLAFVILPFTMGIIGWIGLIIRRQSSIIQSKMADITSILQETISGVKIVKAFGNEEYENKKFMAETKKFFRMMLKVSRLKNASSPITEFLSIIVGAVIIYYGGRLVLIEHNLKAAEFLGFLFAVFQLMPPIKELSGVVNRIQESAAAGDRVFEIIDTDPVIYDAPNPATPKEFKNTIRFKDVSFHYDDSPELVLDKIDFEVKRGEIIALVGPSGGGKTTLVDLIPRFHDPSSGAILLDGTDIRDIKIENLRALMGIVTQETFLFNETIKNNIAYGIKNCPDEKIFEAAKTANAHNFICEMPEGYETVIGERGVKISGGQRQRISIARALLKNPPIMIFDEATSALDNESELLVQEAIDRMMENRTTFVIAHRLSTIRNANRIIVIEGGKIVQAGSHDALIKDTQGLYKKFYEMQFKV